MNRFIDSRKKELKNEPKSPLYSVNLEGKWSKIDGIEPVKLVENIDEI